MHSVVATGTMTPEMVLTKSVLDIHYMTPLGPRESGCTAGAEEFPGSRACPVRRYVGRPELTKLRIKARQPLTGGTDSDDIPPGHTARRQITTT